MASVPLAGHDGTVTNGSGKADHEYFRADLVIDGHRLTTHFVVCNTGRHDLIVGRKLLEDAGVWVNCQKRRLRWPKADLRIDCKRDIRMPRLVPSPKVNSIHQADADRRDALQKLAAVGKRASKPKATGSKARKRAGPKKLSPPKDDPSPLAPSSILARGADNTGTAPKTSRFRASAPSAHGCPSRRRHGDHSERTPDRHHLRPARRFRRRGCVSGDRAQSLSGRLVFDPGGRSPP